MKHVEHLAKVAESEAKRASAVEDALEAFTQAASRATADHDGRLRLLGNECPQCAAGKGEVP